MSPPRRPKTGGRRTLLDALRTTTGAIDLASIMVGVIVIGVIAGVIGATVFAVIPWAQDKAAKSGLDSVRIAESVTQVQNSSYLNFAGLVSKQLIQPSSTVTADTDGAGTCYLALSASQTGSVFWASDKDPTARLYVKNTSEVNAGWCTPSTPLATLFTDIGADPAGAPAAAPLPTFTGQTVLGWASNSLTDMAAEETSFGVRNGMLSTYVDFVGSPAFPADFAAAANTRQSGLLISWEPYDWDVASDVQPSFKPTAITAGNHDTHITNWLTEAQTYAVNGTIMVRFAPEMTDALPWSPGMNGGNTAAEYITMWRHVYAIKQAVAPDVILVWNPLNFGASSATMTDLFPGSAYVDMLALDGFNWYDVRNPGTCGWQSYLDVYTDAIAELKSLAGTKPWGIAEAASAPDKPADFEPGGACDAAWGWARDWPEDPPYYATTADSVTQEGFTKVLLLHAEADGALFVNLFNTVKETDWRVSDNTAGTDMVSAVAGSAGWVSGDQNAAGYLKAALQ